MTRYDRMVAERTQRRREAAEAAVARALGALRPRGIDIRIFGSLARGEFRVHSDVDFLVHGAIDSEIRVVVEVEVAAAMRPSGLPYDLFYLDDMTPEQAAAFRDG